MQTLQHFQDSNYLLCVRLKQLSLLLSTYYIASTRAAVASASTQRWPWSLYWQGCFLARRRGSSSCNGLQPVAEAAAAAFGAGGNGVLSVGLCVCAGCCMSQFDALWWCCNRNRFGAPLKNSLRLCKVSAIGVEFCSILCTIYTCTIYVQGNS